GRLRKSRECAGERSHEASGPMEFWFNSGVGIRPTKLVPRVGGLVGSMKARVRGTDKEKPPRRNPGGQKEPIGWVSAFDRVAVLPVLGLGGRDCQPHLL